MPYFDPASAESESEHYLNVAADLVQRYAPAPTPAPLEYQDKAARAERLIYNWLTQTSGGVVASKSLSGVGSKSFSSTADALARRIVRETMGSYFAGGALTLTVDSSFTTGVV